MRFAFLLTGAVVYVLLTNPLLAQPVDSAFVAPVEDTAIVQMVVEQMPSFPGGPSAMSSYIIEHLDYPEEASSQGITGKVVIMFTVNRDGGLSDYKILRSLHPLLDLATVQMVAGMPLWIPGTQHGLPVRVNYVLPVEFSFEAQAPDADSVYTVSEKMPQFPGGRLAMTAYLDSALVYPKKAKANAIQGEVLVEFVVDKKGKITSPKTRSFIGWKCEEEALRLIKEMPDWTPGLVNGYPVMVRCTVAVRFRIDELYAEPGVHYIQNEESVTSWKSDPSDSAFGKQGLPGFPGGADSMYLFISQHIRYPEKARDWGIQGRVVVRFAVEENGSLSDIQVFQSDHDLLNDEAIRMVRIMPRWNPAMQNGVPVRMYFFLPLNFTLD